MAMEDVLKQFKEKTDDFFSAMKKYSEINMCELTLPSDFKKLETNIDNLSLIEIWEQLYKIINDYCNRFNFFKKNSNIYMGFELSDVKDCIFQSITSSINVFATKMSNDLYQYEAEDYNGVITHGIYNSDLTNSEEDIELKNIEETSRKNAEGAKKKLQSLIEVVKSIITNTPEEEHCKSLYLNYLTQAANQENNKVISHSVLLSNFLYSRNKNTKDHNEHIAMRFEINFLEKLSNDILYFVDNLGIIAPDLFINGKKLCVLNQASKNSLIWEFENIFKTSLINQVLHLYNFSHIKINSRNDEYDYLRYISILKKLPPIWLFENEDFNILRKLSDYVLSILYEEGHDAKFVLIEITMTLFKELVYNFLECTYTYLIIKKYRNFDKILQQTYLDTIESNQLKINISDLEFIQKQELNNITMALTTFLNLDDNKLAPFSCFYNPDQKEVNNTCDNSEALFNLINTAHEACQYSYCFWAKLINIPQIYKLIFDLTFDDIHYLLLNYPSFKAVLSFLVPASLIKHYLDESRKKYSNFPFNETNNAVKDFKEQFKSSKSQSKNKGS